MSHTEPGTDQRAAEAVISHHQELATDLAEQVNRLVTAATATTAGGDGTIGAVWAHRDELVAWLHRELLPHASAEETALYPPAAQLPAGKYLIEGMLGEHRVIAALVTEIETADSPVAAAAAARALLAVFASHLAKENELVLPLLIDAEGVSLAALLDGLHDIVGAEPGAGGCGGHCGCGGDAADAANADAPLLGIDPRLDVRDVPHGERHTRVLAALDALAVDAALVLVAPHAPRPLLAEIDNRYAGQVAAEWLQDGPDVWQIRLSRRPVPA